MGPRRTNVTAAQTGHAVVIIMHPFTTEQIMATIFLAVCLFIAFIILRRRKIRFGSEQVAGTALTVYAVILSIIGLSPLLAAIFGAIAIGLGTYVVVVSEESPAKKIARTELIWEAKDLGWDLAKKWLSLIKWDVPPSLREKAAHSPKTAEWVESMDFGYQETLLPLSTEFLADDIRKVEKVYTKLNHYGLRHSDIDLLLSHRSLTKGLETHLLDVSNALGALADKLDER